MSTALRLSNFEQLYSQLEALPQGMRGQLLDGELVAMTRPFSPHNLASLQMIQQLAPFNRRSGGPAGPGGWIFLSEPELHFPSVYF